MKIRQGFVSNSSSSSFIVAVKAGTVLTPKNVMDTFGVPVGSPVYNINLDIAKCIATASKKWDVETLLDDYGYKTVQEAEDDGVRDIRTISDFKALGFDTYRLRVSNEDGGVESMLYEAQFDIRTPDFAIVGGF